MDPQATLLLALDSLGAWDRAAFTDAMEAYSRWRAFDGFEPIVSGLAGDVFFNFLRREGEAAGMPIIPAL